MRSDELGDALSSLDGPPTARRPLRVLMTTDTLGGLAAPVSPDVLRTPAGAPPPTTPARTPCE